MEKKEKRIPILIIKEYQIIQLIQNGYIDSYINFFYLGSKKTPNLINNYSEKSEKNKDEKKHR